MRKKPKNKKQVKSFSYSPGCVEILPIFHWEIETKTGIAIADNSR